MMNAKGPSSRLSTAVVGCGYFGSLHARRHAQLARLVGVVDTDRERAGQLAAELGVDAFDDHRQLVGRVEAASVAVPAHLHHAVAGDLLKAGIHVLVEKPMTDQLDHAAELVALAERAGVVLQVGLIENYSSTFRALVETVRQPLYIESARVSPWKARASDVDVVLDMMIHDIDVILGMVPSRVASVEAIGAPVLTRNEDIANARLVFENGCVASAVASRVALKSERRIRIFEPDCYTVCDFGAGSIFEVHRSGDVEREGLAALRHSSRTVPGEDSLANEIAEFLACATSGAAPTVDGRKGLEALRVAMTIKQRVREHRALVERHMAVAAPQRPAGKGHDDFAV